MYAEFAKITLLNMANSELFLVKDEEEEEEAIFNFDVLKRRRPEWEFHEKCQDTASSSSSSHDHNIPDGQEQREPVLEDHGDKKFEESNVTEASKESENNNKKKISSGELKAEDDDGFRTPTSSDHKIPVMKQCPPAPRKPKPLASNKRKALPTRTSLQLDFSQEVDSLFPTPLLPDLHRKIKKTRTQDR